MELRHHPSNNTSFVARASADGPNGDSTEAKIDELPATRTKIGDQPFLVTFWQPSNDELALLIKGQPVRLFVMGTEQPIVALDVDPQVARVHTLQG